MTTLALLEPERTGGWFPFGDCRPIAELRVGAWLIRERWEGITQPDAQVILGPPHLHRFVEDQAPPVGPVAPVVGPAFVGHSWFAPSGDPLETLPDTAARLVNDGQTVGWWIPEGQSWQPGFEATASVELHGVPLLGAWDVLTGSEHLLPVDAIDFRHEAHDGVPEGALVIGDPSDVIVLGAVVEPGVVFDVRGGAVVVEAHTHVRAGTRLEGPTVIGPGCELLGGLISRSAIGPRCKLRGEIQASIFLGYANKAHDGFIGHSVVGRWVNLGAGTTTSNLKNTYGPVRLTVGTERIETGRQYLGSLIGDHVKTAIGTMLDTGSAIGVGANVFGATRPAKYIPPFAWGDTGTTMHKEGFLATAARVMPRRNVEFTESVRESLGAMFDAVTT